jgi:hypothetical protein
MVGSVKSCDQESSRPALTPGVFTQPWVNTNLFILSPVEGGLGRTRHDSSFTSLVVHETRCIDGTI